MISTLPSRLRRIAMLVLVALLAPVAAASPRVLVMGAVHDDPNSHYAALKPIADYVAASLEPEGVASVEIVIVPSRDQMLNLLRDGRIDWVSETPFVAVHLAQRTGAKFVARRWKNGTPDYRTLFFARQDSGIESLDDLVGRTVAFEHHNSTSAFFVPAVMLGEKGMDLHALASPREAPPEDCFGYVFSGAEYNTAVWVAKGLVDAGALSESNWRDRNTVPEAFLEELNVFAVSEPMPRAIEVVRGSLDDDIVAGLRRALFTMHEDAEALKALEAFEGTARFDALTESDEAALERIAVALPGFREQFP